MKKEYTDILLSKEYSFGFKASAQFNTSIGISRDGIETRKRNWMNYQKKYTLEYAVMDEEKIKTIQDIFYAVSGSFLGFKFYDFFDNSVKIKDLRIKPVGRNYVRAEREYNTYEHLYRILPCWRENDIRLEHLSFSDRIKKIDHKDGKIYLNHIDEYSITVDKMDKKVKINELINNSSLRQYFDLCGFIYLVDKENSGKEVINEFEILNIDIEKGEVYVLDNLNLLNNFTYKDEFSFVRTYPSFNSNIAFRDSNDNVEFYHIVRFESDKLDITVHDINNHEISTSLVELVIEE